MVTDEPVHVSLLTSLLPRFLRRNFYNYINAYDVDELMKPVHFLPNFYALPGNVKMSEVGDYKAKGLFPMDISSALAVLALQLTDEKLNVLDLCCSPGAKYQLMMESLSPDSLLVGVDYSERRLKLCKSMIENSFSNGGNVAYVNKIPRALLFLNDGCTFGQCRDSLGELIFDSKVLCEDLLNRGERKRKNKSARCRESKQLESSFKALLCDSSPAETNVLHTTYDRVIVDAECTHDASYRHLTPFFSELPKGSDTDFAVAIINKHSGEADASCKKWGNKRKHEDTGFEVNDADDKDKKTQYTDKSQLQTLQRRLIYNGFQRLREGGILVYSTCSGDVEQNEEIVSWLLEQFPDSAMLDPINFNAESSTDTTASLKEETKKAIGACSQAMQQQRDAQTVVVEQAQHLAEFFSNMHTVPSLQGIIPGTIRLGYEVAMSGLFIARIIKQKAVVLV